MYENEKNPSRVFEIYECMFDIKQGDKSVAEFYRELKSLVDEVEMHQPAVTDAATLRGIVRISQCKSFCLALALQLRSQVRGQILEGDSIPTLTATFSRVMRVSTGMNNILLTSVLGPSLVNAFLFRQMTFFFLGLVSFNY